MGFAQFPIANPFNTIFPMRDILYWGPAIVRVGRRMFPNAVWKAHTTQKEFALTLDDGPSLRLMDEALDELARASLRATFFVLLDRMAGGHADDRRRRERVERAIAQGHQIAIHGWNHVRYGRRPPSLLRDDLARCQEFLSSMGAAPRPGEPWLFRPPFGSLNARLMHVLASAGGRVIMADLLPGNSLPTYHEPVRQVVRRVGKGLKPGSIVCMHVGESLGGDGVLTAADAPAIIRELGATLAAEGWSFRRLDELELRSS